MRTYIAIDLKSFYASVECIERGLDPLTTNLVVADASRTEKTICLAVTPSLKSYGLSGRSRLFEVVAKAEEIKRQTGKELSYIIAPPRMQLYVDYSTRIYDIYLKYISSEDIHVYSIDEVFMDVTEYLKLYKTTGYELCKKIIRNVLSECGITATAGIAPNLYLCKIAMDIVAKHQSADEYGVRIAELTEDGFKRQLWGHKPLTDFWRTGPGTMKRLAAHGMYTMGDVARMSLENPELLYKLFGIDAEIIIDHAWGIEPCTIADIKQYSPKTQCLSSGQVLKCPYDFEKARIIVREMTELLVLDMVDKNLITSSLTLTIGYDRENVDSGLYDGLVHVDHYGRFVPSPAHGSTSLPSKTSSGRKIVSAIIGLFDRITDKRLSIRRITISANDLDKKENEQYDFFSNPVLDEKESQLQQAMLSIQKRYGKNAIVKATSLQEGATTIERNSQIGGHKA